MILAAPLLIPFAEAAGITIAAVATAAGASVLQDKIQNYMQENPEKSKRILDVITATMPGGGLGDIFIKEESGDDRSTKDIVLDALGKKKGNYSSDDAEGGYRSKRGRIIKALKEAGKISDKPDPDYDPDKKFKGYKKYFNEGGLAGTKTYHQVRDLTVPQDLEEIMNYKIGGRVNLNIGGNPEEEFGIQTLTNSGMNNIDNQRAEVLQKDIDASKGVGFKVQDLDTLKSIDFVNPTLTEFEFQGLKDGSITKPGSYSKPQARLTNEEYLNSNPNLTAMATDLNRMTDAGYPGFFSQEDSISRPNVQSENYEMDQSFYMNPNSVEQPQNIFQKAMDYIPFVGNKSLSGMAVRGAGNMIKGIGNFFQGDPRQQARNADNKQFGVGDIYGYGMGSASGANKDAFGYNTVSYGGDYEQHMIDTVEKLENLLTKTGRKSFKPGTPNFNKLKDYSKNIAGINEKARIADLEEKERFDQRLAEQLRKANTGYTNRGTRIDYGDYYNADGSTNTSSASNPSNSVGPTSDFGMTSRAAKGGLIGYQDGGLVTMFKQKR